MDFSIEVLKCLVAKLSAIIGDDGVGESELAYDGFSKDILDFSLDDVRQRFYLHLFGEVVNSNE